MFQVKHCLFALAAVLCTVSLAADIYLAGDSTCATYELSKKPLTGWGQALPNFSKTGVRIVNMARPGRSTKSFREQGDWEKLLAMVKPGDFVVIQFAHNNRSKDPKRGTTMTVFKSDMVRFVQEVKEKHAYPVLATPIVERQFKDGEFLGGSHLVDYAKAIREAGHEENVPVVELYASTRSWIAFAGEEGSRNFYMSGSGLKKYEKDNTHLTFTGATHVAEMFVSLSQQNKLPVGDCFEPFKR